MAIRITREQLNRIISILEEGQEKNYEVEGKITKNVDYYAFQRALQYAMSFYKSPTHEQLALDVRSKNLRLTIQGLANIKRFCETGAVPSDAVLIEKDRVFKGMNRGDDSIETQYNITVKAAKETLITEGVESKIKSILADTNKHLRLKKRVSFTTPDEMFRFDFTIVKTGQNKPARDFIASYKSTRTINEIELECLEPALQHKNKKDVAMLMISYMTEILKVVDDVAFLMSEEEQSDKIKEYLAFVYKGRNNATLERARLNPKTFFAGPQPVTLERVHFAKPEIHPISLLNSYTVTLKADGERHLMFIDGKGSMYLINNRLHIKDMGMKSIHKNSIFDVELVHIPQMTQQLVLIFDAYFYDSDAVWQLPLTEPGKKKTKTTRLGLAKEFLNSTPKSAYDEVDVQYKVQLKDFWVPDKPEKIFEVTREALLARDSAQVVFEVDGLIYTPMNLPVCGTTVGDMNGFLSNATWKHVMKWKPSKDNTIDFLVHTVKDANKQTIVEINTDVNNGVPSMSKRLAIFCGKEMYQLTPYGMLISDDVKRGYVPKQFFPPHTFGENVDVSTVRMTLDANGRMLCDNGDEIIDESIVEMRFDMPTKKWVPTRVRLDKTEAYTESRRIGGTANNYEVALSIWETIVNPITEENIKGEVPIVVSQDALRPDAQVYYKDGRSYQQRLMSLTHAMRTFHNRWVKNMSLINRFKGHATSLFDVACGEAGDLHKWIEAGFTSVLGLDVNENNINNATSGALMRLKKEIGKNRSSKAGGVNLDRYAFLPMDTSKPITPASISAVEDADNRKLMRVLWGLEETKNPRLKRFHRMASDKFDMISCQFALHYFFKDEDALNGIIQNVANNIREGGYFIGTCFDGQLIDKLFKEENTEYNGMVKGEKDGKVIWAIRKMYEGRMKPKATGTKISVFIESIQDQLTDMYEEYLVDFDRLRDELAKHGIRQLTQKEAQKLRFDANGETSSGTFEKLYSGMLDYYKQSKGDLDKVQQHWVHDAMKMGDTEKRYSFLNRWFVFVKDSKHKTQVKQVEPKKVADKEEAPKEKKENTKPVKQAPKTNKKEPTPEPSDSESEILTESEADTASEVETDASVKINDDSDDDEILPLPPNVVIDNDHDVETKRPSPTKKVKTPQPKTESESEKEDTPTPPPKAAKKPTKKIKTPEPESESESEKEDTPTPPPKAAKKPTKKIKTPEPESESEKEDIPPPKKSRTAKSKKTAKTSQKASTDIESPPPKAKATKKAPAKKIKTPESDSDSDQKVKKTRNKVNEWFTPESDQDDESPDVEKSPTPPPKVTRKAAPKNVKVVASPPASDDEESYPEEKPRQIKAKGKNAPAKSKAKKTATPESSDDEEPQAKKSLFARRKKT